MWTEVLLLEEFVPEGVMMSNRAFYMILLKASCEYLITLKEPLPKPESTVEETKEPEKKEEPTELTFEEVALPARKKRTNSFGNRLSSRPTSNRISSRHNAIAGEEMAIEDADDFFFNENFLLLDDEELSNFTQPKRRLTLSVLASS
jgi:hypothetical protein